MKKGIIYTLIAAILGLTLVLAPLFTIRAESEYDRFSLQAVSEQLKGLEGRSYNVNVTSPWSTELGFLAISFALALIVYLLIRRRVPQRSTVWILRPPY